jgi:hypothetical protein
VQALWIRFTNPIKLSIVAIAPQNFTKLLLLAPAITDRQNPRLPEAAGTNKKRRHAEEYI